jgi:hypothetical protein
MFCNRFWIENAWEMPKETVRTSELYTGVLGYCSRAAGSVVMTSALHFRVPSQHDVACNDPWRVSDVTQQTAVNHRHKNRRPQTWHFRRYLWNSDRPSIDAPFHAKHSAPPSLLLTSFRRSKVKTDPPNCIFINTIFFMALNSPQWAKLHDCRSFTITLSHTTLSRTPPDEWWARRRDLYLTTHNTHKTQTSMPPAGFETAIPANERPQIHALECVATGIGFLAQISTDNPNVLLLFLSE